jgi:tRNA(Ile2) C34 agmatinyltransferase TiaS
MTPACPMCGGEGEVLGALGSLCWFRCRDCGVEYHEEAERRGPVAVAVKGGRR